MSWIVSFGRVFDIYCLLSSLYLHIAVLMLAVVDDGVEHGWVLIVYGGLMC